jgi:hypothetical protein
LNGACHGGLSKVDVNGANFSKVCAGSRAEEKARV